MRMKKKLMCLWGLPVVILATFLLIGVKSYAADEIRIGVIGPMKFTFGQHMWYAAEMATEKINAQGGIKIKGKSYKIVLTKVDDNDFLSVPDAVSAMERLVTIDKVKYIVGGMRTEAVMAQQEVMADNKVIFLGVGAAHGGLTEKINKDYNRYKYFFRAAPLNMEWQRLQYFAIQAPVLDAIRKELGVAKPKVAIMFDKAQWTAELLEGAKTIFPRLGCEIVGIWQPSFNATAVTAELSAIKSAGAHMIFVASAGPAGNVISRQWGELRIPAAISGVILEAGRDTHWKTSNGLCNYLATIGGLTQDLEMTKNTLKFVDDYMKKYKEFPIYTATGTYDAVNMLKEAIERAQSLDVEALVPALEKTDHLGATVRTRFSTRDNQYPHDPILGPQDSTAIGLQWQNGKLVCIWPDGKEAPAELISAGFPKGWDTVRYKGAGYGKYILPPWVVEYWKGKK